MKGAFLHADHPTKGAPLDADLTQAYPSAECPARSQLCRSARASQRFYQGDGRVRLGQIDDDEHIGIPRRARAGSCVFPGHYDEALRSSETGGLVTSVRSCACSGKHDPAAVATTPRSINVDLPRRHQIRFRTGRAAPDSPRDPRVRGRCGRTAKSARSR